MHQRANHTATAQLPFGSLEGLVPPEPEVARIAELMDACFRVAPPLIQADRQALRDAAAAPHASPARRACPDAVSGSDSDVPCSSSGRAMDLPRILLANPRHVERRLRLLAKEYSGIMQRVIEADKRGDEEDEALRQLFSPYVEQRHHIISHMLEGFEDEWLKFDTMLQVRWDAGKRCTCMQPCRQSLITQAHAPATTTRPSCCLPRIRDACKHATTVPHNALHFYNAGGTATSTPLAPGFGTALA